MTVEANKYKFIELITNLDDENILDELEDILTDSSKGEFILKKITKPIKDKLDIEQLKKEQNYQGFDEDEVEQLKKEIDIREPIDELLDMI